MVHIRRADIGLWGAGLAAVIALVLCLASMSFGGQEPLPWETWEDLYRLAEIFEGSQGLLRSSRCPDGCRYDRHSDGDWRYLYVDGDEGVIFEETGAGAITRIWMTMGMGISVPLDPAVRLRIYLDGSEAPAVDVPLQAFFDGSTPPFVPPLVGDRLQSSGGNFSYVPIPYREGCRVALVGAHEKRIWYQIGFHRLADAEGVETFTGDEDLSGLARLLSTQGRDPWPVGSGTTTTGTTVLAPGGEARLTDLDGPGFLTSLELRIDPDHWTEVELRLTFDGERTVEMALADFFAVGRGGPLPTRSLFLGLDDEGALYSYFPMPFFETATVALVHHGSVTAAVDFEYRVSSREPSPESGLFWAVLNHDPATATGVDFPLLTVSGRGKVVGSFFELGSTSGSLRNYLEGDERIFIDGSSHPAAYGTGVEDYFNGGFYFDQGPLSRALHGAPYTEFDDGSGLPVTAAYRWMLTDGITFQSRIEAGLEGGPVGDVSMRARAVTYFYRQDEAGLYLCDSLDLGNTSDREDHRYLVEGPHQFEELSASFEGEPPAITSGAGVIRPPGVATFTLRSHPAATLHRLRRLCDAGFAGQRATVLIANEVVGCFPPIDVNRNRRWREIDIDLSPGVEGARALEVTVVAEQGVPPGRDETFTAFRYELWIDVPIEIFTDDFESGYLAAWVPH